ncbi:MAG: hypothetical protein M1825_001742 [Sarcosagium campestre]|nr:MAG: hypothetical protein M1825_001742 [Sarcosagium campestre]
MIVFFNPVRRAFPASALSTLDAQDRHWVAKIWIRLGSTVLAIPGLSAMALMFKTSSSVMSPVLLTLFSTIICWNIVNLITLRIRKRPLHPGINVAAELHFWLVLLMAFIFYWIPGFRIYRPRYSAPIVNSYRLNSSANQAYWAMIEFANKMSRCAVTCVFLLLLIHFTLFVMSCRETDHRNRQKGEDDLLRRLHELDKARTADALSGNGNGEVVFTDAEKTIPSEPVYCHRCHAQVAREVNQINELTDQARPIELSPDYVNELSGDCIGKQDGDENRDWERQRERKPRDSNRNGDRNNSRASTSDTACSLSTDSSLEKKATKL